MSAPKRERDERVVRVKRGKRPPLPAAPNKRNAMSRYKHQTKNAMAIGTEQYP